MVMVRFNFGIPQTEKLHKKKPLTNPNQQSQPLPIALNHI